MSAPEPDDDDTEVKFRLTYDEWEKLVDATELIEYYIAGGPNALADRIVCIPPSKREEFTKATLFLARYVKEKITEA
jgi:hypothetical protein